MTKDDQARIQLQSLRNRYEQAAQLYDRFGQAEAKRTMEAIEAEIAQIPEDIRREETVQTKMKTFNEAVEAYILQSAERLLPWEDNLWQALKGNGDATGKAAQLIVELRELGVSDEDLEIAALLAADLKQSRLSLFRYRQRLERAVVGYLTRWAAPEAAETLVNMTAAWSARLEEFRAHYEAILAAKTEEAYSQCQVLSAIEVLKRLSVSLESINDEIREVYGKWSKQ